jgi:hypothetical protein
VIATLVVRRDVSASSSSSLPAPTEHLKFHRALRSQANTTVCVCLRCSAPILFNSCPAAKPSACEQQASTSSSGSAAEAQPASLRERFSNRRPAAVSRRRFQATPPLVEVHRSQGPPDASVEAPARSIFPPPDQRSRSLPSDCPIIRGCLCWSLFFPRVPYERLS